MTLKTVNTALSLSLVIFLALITTGRRQPKAMSDSKGIWVFKEGAKPLLSHDSPVTRDEDNSTPEEAKMSDDPLNPKHKIVGSLNIIVMPDPDPRKLRGASASSNRYLNLDLEGDEWEALFYDVLNCPKAIDEPLTPGENTEEQEGRYSQKFSQAIPEYPMLGRIWDMFIYVSYESGEIKQLWNECLKVKASTKNEIALRGLEKLLNACDEASKSGYGLLFVPD